MFSVRFALVCLAGILIPTSLAVCPSASFIKPCSCKNTHFGSLVLCSRITDAQPIRFAMNVLESYTVGTFTWQQVHIEEPLPADFFQGVTVELFRIVDCKFSFSPNHLPFAGLEDSLLRLDLTSSQVNFAGMHLKHLALLGELNVEKHNLTVVKREWVKRYPTNLRVLRLEQCEITSLEPYVFKPLSKLKLLSLAKNKITHIERNMLPENVHELQTLDLK